MCGSKTAGSDAAPNLKDAAEQAVFGTCALALVEGMLTTKMSGLIDMAHRSKLAGTSHCMWRALRMTEGADRSGPSLVWHLVPQWLGPSRCVALGAVCRTWSLMLQRAKASCALPRELQEVILTPAGELKPSALLHLLGGEGGHISALQSMDKAEDSLYDVLRRREHSKHMSQLLTSYAELKDYDVVEKMMATLKPRCKVGEAVMESLFQPHVERSRMLMLAPRPLHLAVIRSSRRLAGMLLDAAKKAEVWDTVLMLTVPNDQPITLSPLFLAVLFADIEVVRMLESAGCEFNRMDMTAAMRLQRAGLWVRVAERMDQLNLVNKKRELMHGVDAQRAKVASARAAVRAALLA